MRTREGTKIWFDKMIITNIGTYIPEGTGKKPDPATAYTPISLPEDVYPIPTVTPPPEHPRVLFRAKDIPQILENMKHPEMAAVVEEYNKLKDTEYDGTLGSGTTNYDAQKLEVILAKALDYALTGNEANGQNAVSAMKNYAKTLTIVDDCRKAGHVIQVMGQVYDWC